MTARSVRCWSLAAIAILATACRDPAPPPRWAEGGAPLTFAEARWVLDDAVIELARSGQILLDGNVVFVIDGQGRVTDDEGDPVAVLLPDGTVVGTDAVDLGRIGRTNAALPGSETAWITLSPTGQVVLYDADGERYDGGQWTGCAPPALRTCTLSSHLVLLRARQRARSTSGPGFAIGFGVIR